MITSTFDEDCKLISELAQRSMPMMLREPDDMFPLPYLVPGSAYSRTLWDWDSFFLGIAMDDQYAPHFEGAMRTLLHFQQEDGFVAHAVSPKPPHHYKSDEASPCKPLLAQGLLLSVKAQNKRIEDQPWAQETYEKLTRYYEFAEERHTSRHGFLTVMSHRGGGTDNAPTVYGRPPDSTAPMLQNCFLVRDFLAAAEIAEALGDNEGSQRWKTRHKQLADAINQRAWDPIDGLYYDQDVQSETPPKVNQEVTWTLPLKIRSWTCFLPIWAGIAPPDRAQRMIDDHLLDPDSFWSDYGIRTLSKLEPLFINGVTGVPGNPSNWQGPIWGVSNYLVFRSLMAAGRESEAQELAAHAAALYADDIRKTGTLHEFYNTETGEPFCNPDFLNWNLLILTMQKELQTGTDSMALN